VTVGGRRDMDDSRSGWLGILTICKMCREDYEIASNNMGTYRAWEHGAFLANKFSTVFILVKEHEYFGLYSYNQKGFVV
jgi:hypothetical protein